MSIYRYLFIVVATLAVMQVPPMNELAYWYRDAIADGQVWRILTGNLTHTNLWHLAMNACGFVIIAFIYRHHIRPRLYTLLTLVISTIIGLAVWWTDTMAYAGISGTLHGLFAWGAIQDIRQKDHYGWLLLVGILIKIGQELYFGGSESTSSLINARVAIEAHAVGLVAGIILGLIPITNKPLPKG